MLPVFTCLVFWAVNVFALVPIPLEPQRPCYTHFGECLRYCPGERIPDLEGIESSCITSKTGYQFCKFYHCPPTNCGRRRKKDLYGKCYYCPGNCIDGGQIHSNGQGFLSFDMVNSCFCGQDNSKHCTKHPVDQYSYCNHARPGSDGHNSEVVLVEKPQPKAPQIVAFVQPPTQPPPPPKVVAYVQPPTQPPPPTRVAYMEPPTRPPPPPQTVAYVPAPTEPPPPQAVYVPAPTNPAPTQNIAYVPPPYGQQPSQMVAHPDFTAKSPKSNLQQRSNNNPNLYQQNQQFGGHPNQHPNGYPNSHHYNGYPNNPYRMGFPPNPFFGPFPWGFNSFNKEVEM